MASLYEIKNEKYLSVGRLCSGGYEFARNDADKARQELFMDGK